MDIQTNDISLDIIKESVMVFEEAPHSDTILNNIEFSNTQFYFPLL